jgi:phosphoribosylformylglycinamidine synthase subunit PurQ / glutaminase
MVEAARALRQRSTAAEDKLWEALRDRQLAGLKFRRQHPLGPFVLDMFCVEHQLVIEVDGSIHRTPEQAAYDAARTEHLVERGLRILRFTNDEVAYHLPDVLKRILQNIAS